MIPLDIIPTGWFHMGWSAELPPGAVKPLKYFGQDLVAYRTKSGELAVLDAYCHHLGAHLGHGGTVKDDCVVCPYHGWEWNKDGANTLIPYQDKPAQKKLRKWSTVERHGIMFIWYDPEFGPPRRQLPNLFDCDPEVPANEEDYYPCYPHAVVDKPCEPFSTQFMMENAADTAHFQFTHRSPLPPKMLNFGEEADGWRGDYGFISPKSNEVALRVRGFKPNVGLSFTIFDGANSYRLILSGTPIDAKTSHVRVSYFFPRDKESWDVMPADVRKFAEGTDELYEEDARMWRFQRYTQKPIFAQQDVAGYTSFRKWSAQFYEGHPKEACTRETVD